MQFKYNVIEHGTKHVKVAGRPHRISFLIEQFENELIASGYLTDYPHAACTERRQLTGECPIEAAKEMQYWLEQNLIDTIIELSREPA